MRATAHPPIWLPGAEPVPGYRILDHLRRGRDLDVYDAWSVQRHCRCVLKTTRPDRLRGSPRRRLRLEGRLLLSSSHPHLVRAYACTRTSEGAPVVVLETLSGATLAELLDEQPRLGARELGHLGVHLCSAVRYLHGRGYLHLDVKPSNIVAHRGHATLIDLSLARPPGACSAGCGTLGYMSPEQVRGEDVGPAADVWGVGAVLYEAATGTAFAPYAGSPTAPRVRARRRLPGSVAVVIDACLQPAVGRRPTLEVLAMAMAELSGEPPDAVDPVSGAAITEVGAVAASIRAASR